MFSRNTRRKHRKKQRLFEKQDGNCCYCNKKMILLGAGEADPNGSNSPDLATFEHIGSTRICRNRSNNYYNHGGKVVLACHQCNNLRSKAGFRNLPIAQFMAEVNNLATV